MKRFFHSLVIFSALASPTLAIAVDPLSMGPLTLTQAAIDEARAAYEHGLMYSDEECFLKPDEILQSEVPVAKLNREVCKSRSQELLVLSSSNSLVACATGKAEFAMKVSIGSNKIGKTKNGNRKSPLGTYWLGCPRHSELFGIFIPVGYPNMSNIASGFTGNAIGIHGPMRALNCHPTISLAKNWTAGCLAVSRDSQIIKLSEWIFAHWPVKITIIR